MDVGKRIKQLREQKDYTQQQMADLLHMHRSNYSKIENGQREVAIESLQKVAKHFGITLDELMNNNSNQPKEITVEDKSLMEQVKLIQELDPDEKSMVFKLVDTFLTQKRFKEFVNKNMGVAS